VATVVLVFGMALAQQIQVLEVNRPDRTARRLLGKSDLLDAQAAARAVLSGRARARAESGDGPVHSARIHKLAKDSAVKARTQAINQRKAVLVIADPEGGGYVLVDEPGGALNGRQLRSRAYKMWMQTAFAGSVCTMLGRLASRTWPTTGCRITCSPCGPGTPT
jgi:hypothetical protein